jgi:hypothetical protein
MSCNIYRNDLQLLLAVALPGRSQALPPFLFG